MSAFDTLALALFSAVDVTIEHPSEDGQVASFQDMVVLCQRYGFVPGPELGLFFHTQRGDLRRGMFAHLENVFMEAGVTLPKGSSPLNRGFPHTLTPIFHEDANTLINVMRGQNPWGNYSPTLFGADPLTGRQNEDYQHDSEADDALVVGKAKRGHKRLRVLQAGTRAFFATKCRDLLVSRNPLSTQEQAFLKEAAARGFLNIDDLKTIRFREKLPMLADLVSWETYVAALESPSDLLRLAAHWSGQEVSLLKAVPFSLTTSQAKRVLDALNRLAQSDIDTAREEVVRRSGFWKALARHIRSDRWANKYPMACNLLMDNRTNVLKSLNAQLEGADLLERLKLLKKRPGVLLRSLVSLLRLAQRQGGDAQEQVLEALMTALPKVNVQTVLMTLARLKAPQGQTPHFLPSGRVLWSQPVAVSSARAAVLIEGHLRARLANTLPWSSSADADRVMLPTANRSASESGERIPRGTRVKLDFEAKDTVRAFLHWKHPTDVDLSMTLLDDSFKQITECTYYNLRSRPYLQHSGDITDGSRGAAEYIDVEVGKAIKDGVRWIVLTSNIFSGNTFDTFSAYAGIMIRDGNLGKHFDITTIAQKMRLSSSARWNTVAALDLKTGEMVLIDAPLPSKERDNLHTRFMDVSKQVQLFAHLRAHRPTVGDVLTYAGTNGAPPLEGEKVQAEIDTILTLLAKA